ncbi:hypothetical protein [Massilia sp. BHUDP2]|uniref:hypothetical protein n=1 Tax=Massilia sp. BHUDP2 TaxID=3034505 RepID=UPI003905BFDF
MGWYKVGNRILSDAEMQGKSGELLDVAVPSVVTGISIWMLSHLLSTVHFFVVHTTTTKLIYVVSGFAVFLLSYAYRKVIVAMGVIAFFGFIVILVGAAFLEWVLK